MFGLGTGGGPLAGGVAARDSVGCPAFLVGPGFLPVGAMAKKERVVPQGSRGRAGKEEQWGRKELSYYITCIKIKVSKLELD